MKISQTSHKARNVILTGIGGVIIVIGLASYVFIAHGSFFGWTPYPSKNSQGTNSATSEQLNNGTKIKEQSIQNNQTKSGTSGSDQPPVPIPQSNGKSSVEVTLTAVNQTSTSLQIRSLISVLDTTGTCTLTLQKQGSSPSITRTAAVQALSNNVTCKGFDIPLDQLPAGDWQINLNFSSTQFSGSASQTVTIK